MRTIFTLLLCSLFFQLSSAQTETGIWTSFAIDKKIKKWEISAETDIRTYGSTEVYYFGMIDRWAIGTNIKYQIIKPLDISLNYLIMDKINTKNSTYQWRHRISPTVQGKIGWGNFVFSLRERIQMTTKGETWENIWRNRFQIGYSIPNCKITPYISLETFFHLNNPAGNYCETYRYMLSFNYKINRKNAVDLFTHFDHQPDNSGVKYGIYILGVSYKYSL